MPFSSSRSKTNVVFIALSLLLISAALAAGVWFSQTSKNTDPRSKAAGGNSPYLIGAYYFGSFNPIDTYKFIPLHTEALYGRKNDQWGGVRDFYGQDPGVPQNTRGFTGDFSHLKPVIGFYDDSKPETLEKHIKQATQNGIGYFNFYYFWSTQRNEEYLNKGLDSFLQARNNKDMKFMLSITTGLYDSREIVLDTNTTLTDWAAPKQIATIYDKYFSQSNYLRLADGRPVLQLLDTRGIIDGSSVSIANYIGALNQEAINRGVKEPYIIADSSIPGINQVPGISGYTCLVGIAPNPGPNNYQNYVNNIVPYFRNYTDKPYLPCFTANFDERPRMGIIFANAADVRYYDNWTEQAFRLGLQNVKSYMDSQSTEIGKFLTLYAWNEWHEGGIIEPNVKEGAKKLNVIAEVFGLKTGSDACRTTGNCEYNPQDDLPAPVTPAPKSCSWSPQPEWLTSGTLTPLPEGGLNLLIPNVVNAEIPVLTTAQDMTGDMESEAEFKNYLAPADTVSTVQFMWEQTGGNYLIIRWVQDGKSYIDVAHVKGTEVQYRTPVFVPEGTQTVKLILRRTGSLVVPFVEFDGNRVALESVPSADVFPTGRIKVNLVRYAGDSQVSVQLKNIGGGCI